MATPDTLGVGPKPITSGITATASSTYGAGWEPYRAFDTYINGGSYSWSAAGGSGVPAWLQAQLATPATVTAYKIYARTDAPQTTPSAWTLDASNDGTTWTTLDTQTGQSWFGGQGRQYSFSNSTAYTYYRLSITAVQSAGSVPALTELILCEGTGTSLLDWWKADAITGVTDGASLAATSIPDSSGNNHTFNTSVRAGVYRATTGPNSKPFIDGSTTSGFTYSGPAVQAPVDNLTYFAVLKTSSSAVQSIIGSVNGSGAQLRLNNYQVELDQDGTSTVAISTKTVLSNTWMIVIATYAQSTGQYTVNINGVTETIAGPANRVFNSPGSTLSFGGYRGSVTNAWLGGIAEVGRYTTVLSSADQTSLYNYLLTKYFPNPSSVQVETDYVETMATGSAMSQVEANYVETMASGTMSAQVEANYVETMASGTKSAQIEANYVEAMTLVQPAQVSSVYAETVLTGTPPSQIEAVYMEALLSTTPPVNAESVYLEVLVVPIPGVNFVGWGEPI